MLGKRNLSLNTREDAIEAFVSLRPAERVLDTLYLVEARAPSTHCVFLPVAKPPNTGALQAARGRMGQGSKIVFASDDRDAILMTFEYEVEVSEWQRVGDGTTKKLRRFKVRHPEIVRIKGSRCVITYPGYTQGAGAHGGDSDYEKHVAETIGELRAMGFHFSPFPVRGSIEKLVQAGTRRFVISRAKTKTPLGDISVSSTERGKAMESVVGGVLAPQLIAASREMIERAFSLGLQKASTDALVLWWKEEVIGTRLEFWSVATEFLVVWGKASRTYSSLERLFDVLWTPVSDAATGDAKSLWEFILSAAEGDVLLLSDCVARFSVSREAAESTLKAGLTAGLLEPVFTLLERGRVTEQVGWTIDLASLRRCFPTDDDDVIDGADPRTIAVGFRRVHEEQPA